jgi:hypothetical protein
VAGRVKRFRTDAPPPGFPDATRREPAQAHPQHVAGQKAAGRHRLRPGGPLLFQERTFENEVGTRDDVVGKNSEGERRQRHFQSKPKIPTELFSSPTNKPKPASLAPMLIVSSPSEVALGFSREESGRFCGLRETRADGLLRPREARRRRERVRDGVSGTNFRARPASARGPARAPPPPPPQKNPPLRKTAQRFS